VPKVDYLIILSCPLAPKNVKGQRLSRKNGQRKFQDQENAAGRQKSAEKPAKSLPGRCPGTTSRALLLLFLPLFTVPVTVEKRTVFW